MKGQNIENNVNKKNSVGYVKLIRKKEIIVLRFSYPGAKKAAVFAGFPFPRDKMSHGSREN